MIKDDNMETKRCVFVGVGGQGNLLASRLLGEAALSQGIPAVVSEIHGMAQRGGIVEGEADVLIGFEPVETTRHLNKCRRGTLVITNTQPLPPFTVAIGQGTYPPVDEVLDLIQTKVERVIALNGNQLAEEAGNRLSLNMVMLGALIGAGAVHITPDVMKTTISDSTKKAFLESNIKAFDLGREVATMLSRTGTKG
jgi:indolepyruvate ferredoxin oxidoreductase beta subunit